MKKILSWTNCPAEPGWIFKDESMKQDNWSMCYIEVMPRENVRPAHAHLTQMK